MINKPSPKTWWQIEIKTPAELIDPLANFLAEIGADGFYQNLPASIVNVANEDERQSLTAYLTDDAASLTKTASLTEYIDDLGKIFPQLPAVSFSIKRIAGQDWGQEWKKFFHPFRIGRNLVIKPSWEEFEAADDDLVITLDPGMAFGTGHHPTTRMCLEALEMILGQITDPELFKVLDVGCGTGILAIAAAKLGAGQVTGIDSDGLAVETARENARMNNVSQIVFSDQPVSSIKSHYDLILANLALPTLIELQPHFSFLLLDGGKLVISGILDQQRDEMERHFLLPTYNDYQLLAQEEWVCLVCQKGRVK